VIVLIGFMGAGKSSVGRLVASKLGLPFIDTDANVVARAGRSIPEIFEQEGEPGFRELEREVVYEALDGPDAVVALGGGSLGDKGTRSKIEKATVFHLDVSYAVAMERIGDDRARPMLQGDTLSLYRERDAVYRAHSDVTIATDGRAPEDVATEVSDRLGARR
jgi:shikimate kinase